MTCFWAIRVGDALHPDGTESHAAFSHVPFGKPVRVEVKQPRNGNHHRLFWALCARIATSIGAESENIADLFKVATGHATVIRSKTYGELRLPKSISFAKMDQTQFDEFFNRCVLCAYEEWKIPPEMIADLLAPTPEPRK